MSRSILLCLFALFLPTLAFADATLPEADMPGSSDPTGLARYEGSLIVEYQKGAYDELKLPLSKLIASDPPVQTTRNNRLYTAENTLELEGMVTRVVYLAPEQRTPLEVFRNYQEELGNQRAELLYTCSAEACGGEYRYGVGHGGGDIGLGDILFPVDLLNKESYSNAYCAVAMARSGQRYGVFKLQQGDVELHVAVLAWRAADTQYCKAFNERTFVEVVSLEAKAREQKMITIKASELESTIASAGKIALYGILFDVDAATLKAESNAQIAEIGELLKRDAGLKLLVVGHTDNTGSVAHNMDLSQRRAQAVVAELVGKYGIAAERLEAQGLGSAAPVASNDTDEGRAKNRRVELVKQ